MSRWICIILLVGAVAGGAYFCLNFQVEVHRREDGKLRYVMITPRADQGEPPPAGQSPDQPPAKPPRPSIRIATFNLARCDQAKLANRRVGDVLSRVIPQFDVVAVQDVRARDQGVLLRLVEQINATGQQYDFATAATVQGNAVHQYSAFVFDRTSVEVDRSTVQPVEDPAGRFRHRPLVALFRVRGPDPAEAFTFKLVNVHVDLDRAAVELDLLDDVYRAVRDDGSNEDDVIVLGDFGTGDGQAGALGKLLDVTWSISGTPTTLRGTRPVDNILFSRQATGEFTGKAEVVDLMRAYDLTLPEALEVSDHLPVWAEFSSYEGGQAAHVADGNRQFMRQ
jgi:deoxyribonuclease-1-like protein